MKGLPRDWLDQIKETYPKRSGGQGWTKAAEQIRRHIKSGATFEEILDGTRRYRDWCNGTSKTGSELVKMAQTFYGPGKWWTEDYDLPVTSGRYDHLRDWAEQ